jgi:hypothetical protein
VIVIYTFFEKRASECFRKYSTPLENTCQTIFQEGRHIPWIAISMIMPATLILFGGHWGYAFSPIVPVFR